MFFCHNNVKKEKQIEAAKRMIVSIETGGLVSSMLNMMSRGKRVLYFPEKLYEFFTRTICLFKLYHTV